MASRTVAKDIITLRGSAAIVSEFFGYAANSILYNRGVYPEESFAKVKKYGLPMLLTQDEGLFDVLAYTDKDVAVPFTWIESDPKLIANPQMVKLHSFDTKIHKVDTLVSYKNDEWEEQVSNANRENIHDA
ncbi:mitotic spindle checkpoint protein MAD2-like [Gossypium australe]|uniref:Mitotic spindle checkpoint protein MAD2-like n=1 Tax=Gossypium australe TaxID=47621 RepID=A0A5B6WNG6_9ROSI|nr:mitotic spindle checkpoint protein MAD2-like [Gossypium australe]